MTDKKYKDKEWLQKQYVEKEQLAYEVAQKTNVTRTTILTYLHKYNLARSQSENTKLVDKRKSNDKKYRDKTWLKRKYKEKGTLKGVAKECNVTETTIRRWMHKYNLYIRPHFKDRNTKSNLQLRLENNIARAVKNGLKRGKEGKHWGDLVGYELQELQQHIEKQFKDRMNWNNYGKNGWEIDHIIPRSFFTYEKLEDKEFQKCWALENLQPLWAEENLAKNNSLDWSDKQKEVAEKLDIDLER